MVRIIMTSKRLLLARPKVDIVEELNLKPLTTYLSIGGGPWLCQYPCLASHGPGGSRSLRYKRGGTPSDLEKTARIKRLIE